MAQVCNLHSYRIFHELRCCLHMDVIDAVFYQKADWSHAKYYSDEITRMPRYNSSFPNILISNLAEKYNNGWEVGTLQAHRWCVLVSEI